MPQAVVDEFELVEVDKGDGDMMTVTFRRHDCLLKAVVKAIPVRQPGQGVVVGQIFQPGFILLVRSQIHRHHVDDGWFVFDLQNLGRQKNR